MTHNVEFRIVYLCFIGFIPLRTLSPHCGGAVAFAKGGSHVYSQQDRGVDAAAVGAAGPGGSGPTRRANRNIGWGRRFPIRNPSDRTLQRANSNDFANERPDGATTPLEYDATHSRSFCRRGCFVRSGGRRRGGAGGGGRGGGWR